MEAADFSETCTKVDGVTAVECTYVTKQRAPVARARDQRLSDVARQTRISLGTQRGGCSFAL
jgi:hypothetical protein